MLCLAALTLAAQKAEPVRIEFAHGATSSTLRGSLTGLQQMEYALTARSGQRLTLRLTASPAGTLALKLYNPSVQEVPLHNFSATLPQSGDYTIVILRTSNRSGSSSYKLRVTIR